MTARGAAVEGPGDTPRWIPVLNFLRGRFILAET